MYPELTTEKNGTIVQCDPVVYLYSRANVYAKILGNNCMQKKIVPNLCLRTRTEENR